MRITKFIAHATGLTRTQSKAAIKAGRVVIDNKIIKNTAFVLNNETVLFDNKPLKLNQNQSIVLYKPAGYICSNINEVHPSALNLLKKANYAGELNEVNGLGWLDDPLSSKLNFAGRLDQDTTGLVILTTDGTLIHQITSPNKNCTKDYIAELAEPINDSDIVALEKGVLLKGENSLTKPCVIKQLDKQRLKIRLSEGRYHQVKRMLASVGNKIVSLHRARVGKLELKDMKESQWRFLIEDEIKAFY